MCCTQSMIRISRVGYQLGLVMQLDRWTAVHKSVDEIPQFGGKTEQWQLSLVALASSDC
jgi:hypothetical protein